MEIRRLCAQRWGDRDTIYTGFRTIAGSMRLSNGRGPGTGAFHVECCTLRSRSGSGPGLAHPGRLVSLPLRAPTSAS